MYVTTGNCPHCGAPIMAPAIWHGIYPPPPYYTCECKQARYGQPKHPPRPDRQYRTNRAFVV